jgi:hypothetical protein
MEGAVNPVISRVLNNICCRGCPIYEGEGRERRMEARDKALKLNKEYVPEVVKVLFVGESPPWRLMCEEEPYSYFYASGPERPKSLAYYMSQVLFGEVLAKEEFFKRFMESGYYFVDMVKCPMYGLSSEERRKAARHCAKYLDEELRSLKPEAAIFMGKGTFKLVKGLLKLDLPHRVVSLPFGNVAVFKRELEEALTAPSRASSSRCPSVPRRA